MCVCEQFAFVCVSVISSVFQRVSLPPNNTILLFSFSPAGKETKHKRFQWWDFFKIFFVQVPKRKKRKKRVCLCVSVCCTRVCAHAVPCVCMRRCVPDFKNRIFFFFLTSFFCFKKKSPSSSSLFCFVCGSWCLFYSRSRHTSCNLLETTTTTTLLNRCTTQRDECQMEI